jgi:hypothetical protein
VLSTENESVDVGIPSLIDHVFSQRFILVYIYGFSKIEGGRYHGAFFHPDFVRGKKDRCLTIGRNKSGDRRLKSSVSQKVRQIQQDRQSEDGEREQEDIGEASMPMVAFSQLSASPAVALPMDPLTHLRRHSGVARAPSPHLSSKIAAVPSGRQLQLQLQHHPQNTEEDWLHNTLDLDPLEEVPSEFPPFSVAAVAATTHLSTTSSSPSSEWDMSFLEPRTIEEMQETPLALPLDFASTERKQKSYRKQTPSQQPGNPL